MAPARSLPLRHRRLVALCLAAVFALAAQPLSAQGLRVRVIDRESRAPVAGAILSMIDAQGQRITATLSDEIGAALLQGGGDKPVRVEAQRIGYATVTTPVLDRSQQAQGIEIELTARTFQLPAVAVRARRSCQTNPDAGTAAGALWAEVRKTLTASVLADGRRTALRILRYVRTLDGSLRVLAETTSVRQSRGEAPFIAAQPEVLSRDGFVRTVDGAPVYFAPDATVLLSEAFVNDHCFGVAAPEDAGPLVGLTFEPARGRVVPDVAGVLWVDRRSGELRRLEYRYTGPSLASHGTHAGGRLDFALLPTGEWIVRHWYIRMPRTAVIRGQRLQQWETAARDTVIGYREEGGWVALPGPDPDATNAAATLIGTVHDSVSGRALPGVRVVLGGGAAEAMTDDAGRYRLQSPLPGRYMVAFEHPRLTMFAALAAQPEAVLARGATSTLDWGTASATTLRDRLCPQRDGDPAPRTVVTATQVVDSASREPIVGARVVVSWRQTALRQSGRLATAAVTDSTAELETGVAGAAFVCVPRSREELVLRAEHDGRGVEHRSPLGDAPVLHEVTLTLGASRERSGVLQGSVVTVVEGIARPLASAEVLVPALARASRTAADGSFVLGRLGVGPHTVLVRRLGYQPLMRRVVLPVGADSGVVFVLRPLAPELTAVPVVADAAERGSSRGFEERRAMRGGGTFLTREQLARREHSRLSDVLRGASGARFQRTPEGRMVLSSRRGATSIQSKGCYFQIYLDGMRLYAPGEQGPDGSGMPPSIDDFAPAGLEAVEVYAGPATTPAEFNGVGGACGTLLLWTRGR